jgi:hypothetical protein
MAKWEEASHGDHFIGGGERERERERERVVLVPHVGDS